ncbi:MAG: PEP-CTERM sorting domain-containing protein [Syntrophobacteraceae bacterium]|jgi:hypothetical protein
MTGKRGIGPVLVSPLLSFLLVLLFESFAMADTINVSTGLDSSSNNLITTGGTADAHWTINGSAAQVVSPGNADWPGVWVENGPSSAWIAQNANTNHNGTGSYTCTFDLSGYDLSTVSLSGSWTLDDAGILSINGNIISISPDSGQWTFMSSFNVLNSDFTTGVNTLTIAITQSDNNMEGVRLEGLVTGTSAVPEPCTMLLIGSGLVGLAAFRRKFKAA